MGWRPGKRRPGKRLMHLGETRLPHPRMRFALSNCLPRLGYLYCAVGVSRHRFHASCVSHRPHRPHRPHLGSSRLGAAQPFPLALAHTGTCTSSPRSTTYPPLLTRGAICEGGNAGGAALTGGRERPARRQPCRRREWRDLGRSATERAGRAARAVAETETVYNHRDHRVHCGSRSGRRRVQRVRPPQFPPQFPSWRWVEGVGWV